ncbi:MAG: bifunctional diaminohydroxyphosphoribosylaminopyrimidine deaminase/5-amino-6-(5-phosphoribosylamino)uracil reductase RibD, partial [Chloroflexota bacterium]
MDYMKRALELAALARGHTSPNPMVGAVLVKDGQVLGEGFHRRAGEPHAEVHALRQAGEAARGATLYVNLEPCAHYGRTPPCTRELIAAGIARVHMAMLDPNPLVSGRGKAEMEAAGITTAVGEHEEEARALNEVFAKYITTGYPFVIAKFAMSLDGKIATSAGESRWITGQEARRYVHDLRDTVDAVMVGVNTVIADDPLLTARLEAPDLRQPLRVIVDSKGRTPLYARVLDPGLPGKTIIATSELIPEKRLAEFRDQGIEVLISPARGGMVDLERLMQALGQREISSVLLEGGGTILASAFAAGLVDKVLAFIAPKIIGGKAAPTPVGGEGAPSLAQALTLKRVAVERLGPDVL